MKVLISLFIIFCLAGQVSKAQNFKASHIKSGSKEYKTSKSKKYVVVGNVDNVINKNRKLPEALVNDGYEQHLNYKEKDYEKILSLIKDEYVRSNRKIPSESPLISFYINESGDIRAMEFLLRENTTLTIDDVRIIEDALKGKFKFNTNAQKLKGAGYVSWSSVIGLGAISQK